MFCSRTNPAAAHRSTGDAKQCKEIRVPLGQKWVHVAKAAMQGMQIQDVDGLTELLGNVDLGLHPNTGLPAVDGENHDPAAACKDRQVEIFPERPIRRPTASGEWVTMLDGREHEVAGTAEKRSCQACKHICPFTNPGVGVGVG